MKIKAFAIAAILLAGFGLSPASANIIFQLGNNPQPDEANILFGAPQTGMTINGEVDHTGIGAIFSTLTGETLLQNSQGQASITNNAGKKVDLTSMNFTLDPGFGFTDFIFNPLNGHGNATVTVGSATFTYALGNGQNFLTILATGSDVMTEVSVTMDAGGGFLDFKQPRVSGACEFGVTGGGCTPVVIVAEPGVVGLIGIALLALGGIRRRTGYRV